MATGNFCSLFKVFFLIYKGTYVGKLFYIIFCAISGNSDTCLLLKHICNIILQSFFNRKEVELFEIRFMHACYDFYLTVYCRLNENKLYVLGTHASAHQCTEYLR